MNIRILLLLLACLPGLPAAAIDLTPRWTDTFIDGIASRRLYFADGDKKILIGIDRETSVRAGSGGSVFQFPKFPDSTFILTRSRNSPEEKFADLGLERYREAARRFPGPRARDIEVREETSEPLRINDWHSFRLVMTYTIENAP